MHIPLYLVQHVFPDMVGQIFIFNNFAKDISVSIYPDAYTEPSQIRKMELFSTVING